MSGHSRWATIKRKKGAADAKRGALFSKLIREITVAARDGGEDQTSNARLKTVVAKAKSYNMPSDNIDRAIKKAVGGLDGVTYEEIRYEGYGPGGTAFMIDSLTDNKKRTGPEIRTIFSKNGGNLGESGSVGYMFVRKGIIIIEPGQTTEDETMELLIDHGVEDIKTEESGIVITTAPEIYNDVNDIILEKKFKTSLSEITFIPTTTVSLDEKKAGQCLRLVDQLESHDDVQNVYSNYDISDEIMKKVSEEQ